HGGQVLVSESTRSLLEGEEPPGASLRDLGPQVYHFSPPSSQPVTAQTFKDTIERSLSRANNASNQQGFMQDLVGVGAYETGKAPHISGVVARGDTLTISLTKPSGSLPARLATPYFCAVPSSTPASAQGVPAIPSAGPYYVAFYAP